MASPTRSSLLSLLLEQSLEEEETVMWTLLTTLLSRSEEAATNDCVFLPPLIKLNDSLRLRSKLKRPALPSPGPSPWSRLLASEEESSS